MQRIICILIIVALAYSARAQDSEDKPCVQNIQTAQQRYDEGRIQDIEPLLLNCLEQADFTKAQKAEALRLLTLAYIFLDEDQKAEATMLRLLKTNHEFRTNPAIDPTEFITLYNQFRHEPVFNIGFKYIVNLSQVQVTQLNSALDLNSNKPAYQPRIGLFGLGINFEYKIADRLYLFPELQFRNMAIQRTQSQTGTATGSPYISTTTFEEMQWLSLPVSAKYVISFEKQPKFKLYLLGGLSVDYLLKATKPVDANVLQMINDQDVTFQLTTTPDKKPLNFGAQAGLGTTYKVGEGFLSLELRYAYSFTNLTKPGSVLQPSQAAQINTLIQDDIYKLHHIAISLGYTLNIYIPKPL